MEQNLTKHTESASLPDVVSKCGGGKRCAKPEHEGRGRNAPSSTSHEEKISGWFADEVGLGLYPGIICYILEIDVLIGCESSSAQG